MATSNFSNQLKDPVILVDGERISIVPGTLVTMLGLGEKEVMAAARGNGVTESVFIDKGDTQVAMVKFDMYNTDQTQAFYKRVSLKNVTSGIPVSIQLINEAQSTAANFTVMWLTNDPENSYGTDSAVSLEFKGNPAI